MYAVKAECMSPSQTIHLTATPKASGGRGDETHTNDGKTCTNTEGWLGSDPAGYTAKV